MGTDRKPGDASDARRGELGGANILVVDDHAPTRTLLRFDLERRGAKVAEAAGGRQALAVLSAAEFDVVLLDLRMDDLDGFCVLEQARERAGAFIMMTAEADAENRATAARLGAMRTLAKPLELASLHAALATALDRPD